ncbi:nucleotidyltransferase family protein [Candidatus Poriferisodalis sp.]|uniref:nucleotidyltransferase family protein n=1 Tax=Candidatus Poriferisodalis sp. TaxID=3101277 RepID=UPI003C6EC74E
MSRREEILARHRNAILDAARRHNASSIALAGSVARGTDHDESDGDFVCTFDPGTTLLDVAALQRELRELLGCDVDVSSAKALEPPYTSMLRDAISL